MSSPKNIILVDGFNTKTPANSPSEEFSNMKKMTIVKNTSPNIPITNSPTHSPTSKFSPTHKSSPGFSPVQNILGRINSIKSSLSPSKSKETSSRYLDDDVFDLSDEEEDSDKLFKIFNSGKS